MSRPKKFISLPNHHLSYSQMSLWMADKKRYAALYFDRRSELRISNMGQKYGSVVANALEHGKETGDLVTDSAMLLLPKYDVADDSIEVDVKTKDGWLNLLGKPDTFDSKTCDFREYKTGKVAWTQSKAEKHLQLPFYAVVIWQKFGVMPKGAWLDWIETIQEEDGTIVPTGRVEHFYVEFTKMQLLETLANIIRCAKDIEIAWASHVTNPELINF